MLAVRQPLWGEPPREGEPLDQPIGTKQRRSSIIEQDHHSGRQLAEGGAPELAISCAIEPAPALEAFGLQHPVEIGC